MRALTALVLSPDVAETSASASVMPASSSTLRSINVSNCARVRGARKQHACVLPVAAAATEQDWDDVMNTNLKGAFFLSQLFGRACIVRGKPGAIVSMASTHGMTGIAGRSVYGISKAGKNDCQTATSSCAGTSKKDGQTDAWLSVPKGSCEKIVGGSLAAKK